MPGPEHADTVKPYTKEFPGVGDPGSVKNAREKVRLLRGPLRAYSLMLATTLQPTPAHGCIFALLGIGL